MKRTKMLGLAVVLTALGAATIAVAAPAWTAPTRISQVWSGYTDKAVYVNGFANSQACASPLVRFSTAVSDPDKILTLATSAQLSGKKLACFVNGCDGDYQRGQQCFLTD